MLLAMFRQSGDGECGFSSLEFDRKSDVLLS